MKDMEACMESYIMSLSISLFLPLEIKKKKICLFIPRSQSCRRLNAKKFFLASKSNKFYLARSSMTMLYPIAVWNTIGIASIVPMTVNVARKPLLPPFFCHVLFLFEHFRVFCPTPKLNPNVLGFSSLHSWYAFSSAPKWNSSSVQHVSFGAFLALQCLKPSSLYFSGDFPLCKCNWDSQYGIIPIPTTCSPNSPGQCSLSCLVLNPWGITLTWR